MIHPTIRNIIVDPEDIIRMEPDEVGLVILHVLNGRPEYAFMPHSINNEPFPLHGQGYPRNYEQQVKEALMEGWVWLQREGLVAPSIDGDEARQGRYFVTRRGRSLKTPEAIAAYRQAIRLPKELLHHRIAERVWSLFIRGDHDTAVFQAFKEVEVAVRSAGRFPANLVGVDLMRQAFRLSSGPLTDVSLPSAEQDALAHLFAGAIGSYKNPQSHRTVTITDPSEAYEMILLASHLLRIVDARASATRP